MVAENRKVAFTRIMVFGTFDVVHPGHIHFFKQARKLAKNPYLIVSIARDKNVKRIKGKLPFNNEKKRARAVRKTGLADTVVLGGITNHIQHILKARPEIIALGYDQKAYTENLRSILKNHQHSVKILRLKAHKVKTYKSSIIKKRLYGNKGRK